MPAAQPLADNDYASFGYTVAEAQPSERVAFVRKTYTHLAVAVYAFAALEWVYFQSGIAEKFLGLLQGVPYAPLIMLGAFIAVSWVADSWARSDASPALQYAGLFGYVIFESLFFIPILWFAQTMSVNVAGVGDVNVIGAAGVATIAMFGLLTAIAWFSGTDFSFLRSALFFGGIAAMALIAISIFFGMHLGVWFTVAMIAFAAGYILYDTSNVMHHYQPNQHVAASLALFASVALMFWYVLQLFMSFSDD